MANWRDLINDPPNRKENECVLLFPCISDVGILYSASNIDYALGPYAVEAGYTHWMPIPRHPNQEKVEQLIQELYNDG